MCPQPREGVRGAHGAVRGAQTRTRLCPLSVLESGTGTSRVPSQGGHRSHGHGRSPIYHGSPSHFHQTSSLPGSMISASYRHGTGLRPKAQPPPPLRPPQRCCSLVPGGRSRGAHRAPIPTGLREETDELTPKTSRPHGGGTEGCCMPPPDPDRNTNTINIPSPSL